MKAIFLIIGIILFANNSCTPCKYTFSSKITSDDLINTVIVDFLKTSKLSKKDSIFALSITDIETYVIIGIGIAENKVYPNSTDMIGIYNSAIPNKHVIINNKLFYWNDPNTLTTQPLVDALVAFNHIDFDWSQTYDLPPYAINDGYKSIVYYVCKNNFKNYRKAIGGTIQRRHRAPKINCK